MPRLRRLLRWAVLASAGLLVLGAIALGVLYVTIASDLPDDVESLREVEMQEPMYVYARDGQLMALFGETRRYPVQIEQVPERLKQAFIAIEDARFYEHGGVDYKGVLRAVWLMATTDGRRVPGGSTITQQVTRQFFLSNEYSIRRKLAEMLLAMRMEKELSKDEIFELYLNKSFFGNRAYGIAAAAEFYYGKTLDQLTLDEMASLAGIPKFPSSGNPISNPERAKMRRDYILQRMAELKFITPAEAAAAQRVPMHAAPHERPVQVYAPYVAEMVRQEMIARFGAEALTKGYHVTTTIDPDMQAAADRAVRTGLATYDRRHGWRGAERKFELAAEETPKAIAERLRGIVTQGGLRPAIVLATSGDGARVVLSDASTVTLGPKQGWGGRAPASLVKRGDMVRVSLVPSETDKDEAKDKDAAAAGPAAGDVRAAAETSALYRLDQLPRAQSALISLDADTGAIMALTGGLSFAANKFNRVTQARLQPGSSFKPFVYAAAFERGYNPASIVLDAPVVFRDRRGHTWRPQNDTGNFAGPMRLREAMVQSRNLVSVRMLDAIGVEYARKYITQFGFEESELPPNLSIALGTPSLTPLSVARGYAVFANGGFRITPWLIRTVKDRNGAIIHEEKPLVACPACVQRSGQAAASTVVDGFDLGPVQSSPPPRQAADANEDAAGTATAPDHLPDASELAPRAIDERIAYQIVSMLRDVVKRGTGTAAKVLGREDIGGKTGSTNEHRDAWFSGVGGRYVTTVWVGRDDHTSLGYREYGGKAALPIWIDYMRVALEDEPIRPNVPPPGMVQVTVGPNGTLIPGDAGGIVEWVKTEDLDRMQNFFDYGTEEAPPEESFDIF